MKFKKVLIYTTSMFLIITATILSSSIKAYAWDAHLNEDGDIEIMTVDKKKTSQIWYYSDGLTITRCKFDPAEKAVHASGEWFYHDFENPVHDQREATVMNIFTIPLSEVIAYASAEDPAWGKEIEDAYLGDGPACYIKLDCIMYTVDNTRGGIQDGPFINAPGIFGGDGHSITGLNSSGVEIVNKYSWGNKEGLKSHFNQYLIIGKGEIVEATPLDDEFVVYDYTMDHYAGIDANAPAYATGNSSSLFDLSQGIPSSEYVDNRFFADSWYGNTNVYARTVSKSYTWTMYYYWLVPDGHWEYDDENNPEAGQHWVDTSYWEGNSYNIPIGNACAAFQYLADTNIYDFTNADIGNGCYDGDHIYYDDTREIPVTLVSTNEYKDVGTSVGTIIKGDLNWKADTKQHLIFTVTIHYSTSRRLNSSSEVPYAIKSDLEAIRAQLSSRTLTRNDKLEIDGTSFMRNEWVTGCDFFEGIPNSYKSCSKSSAVVLDYTKQGGGRPLHAYDPANVDGSLTTQIPATVDNGYYYTTMHVFYQKLAPYKKTLSEFFAGE